MPIVTRLKPPKLVVITGSKPMPIEPGDMLMLYGIPFMFKTIKRQYSYYEPKTANWYWDVQFIDHRGGSRRWQSEFDGGRLVRANEIGRH